MQQEPMPTYLPGLPFPPLALIDTDSPIELPTITELLDQRHQGVSLCVRSATGAQYRGGYFFHFRPIDSTMANFEVFNFEKISVVTLPVTGLLAFINHCSGLAFDQASFDLCQTTVNFRLDPTPSIPMSDAGPEA
jgi:hypothetical protein